MDRLRLVSFITALMTCSVAFGAGSAGVTYQGRILRPDGSPLSGSNVEFKLQIRTPNANDCLMYEEVQAVDMSHSNGSFSLTMADGSGTRTDSTGLSLDRIFANRGSFTFAGGTCASGSNYTPASGDSRSLVMLFKDETMAQWEPAPAVKLNSVPSAFASQTVQGFSADSLLRVVNAGGDPLSGLAPLSNAQYTELMALVDGTSTRFSELNGVVVPAMTTGEVLGWNGTQWVSQSMVGGANSVTNTMIQANAVDSSKIASGAVGTSQIASNVSISTSGTLASAVTTTRDFKIFAASPSTFYVGLTAPALASSYTLTLPASAPASNGQVLSSTTAGVLSWITPAAGGGGLPAADGTQTAPSISFTNSTGTGFYLSGANKIGVANGGVGYGSFEGSAVKFPNSTFTGYDFESSWNGTASSPTFSFPSESTGLFRPAAGVLGFAGNGSEGARIGVNGSIATFQVGTPGSFQGIARLSGGTSGYVDVKTAAAAGTWTMTLPANAGTSNQVLTTDGAGILTWKTPSGGGATTIDGLTDARTTATSVYMGNGAGASGTAAETVGIGVNAFPVITTGAANTGVGYNVGQNLTTQTQNTLVGWQAGYTLAAGTAGSYNTLIGYKSGFNNTGTLGQANTAVGSSALYANDGNSNTALGSNAMNNSSGSSNTAVGVDALFGVISSNNVGVGAQAGYGLTAGAADNVLIGRQVMFSNGTGNSGARNTVVGTQSLSDNSAHSGNENSIFGYGSGVFVTSGGSNTILGANSGTTLTTGSNNILIGAGVTTPTATTSNYLNIGNTIHSQLSTGKVGIGTTSPAEKLEVAGNVKVGGRVTQAVSSNGDALTSVTADFSSSNMIRSTATAGACGTLNFTNVVAGASYTVTLVNATTTCATVQLAGSTSNVKLPTGYAGGSAVSGIVYTALYDGVTLWVSHVPF